MVLVAPLTLLALAPPLTLPAPLAIKALLTLTAQTPPLALLALACPLTLLAPTPPLTLPAHQAVVYHLTPQDLERYISKYLVQSLLPHLQTVLLTQQNMYQVPGC